MRKHSIEDGDSMFLRNKQVSTALQPRRLTSTACSNIYNFLCNEN